jgi:membrane protein YdbS with pleckstrin-like domain
MNMQNETLYQSPFVFLKKFIVIEIVFALLPIVLLLTVDVERLYQSIGLERSVPFVLMWTFFLLLLQIIAVSAAFAVWYMPRYVLNRDGVFFRQGSGGVLKKVIDYSQISDLKVEQGPLARRLGYGSIALFRSGQDQPVIIKDVPDPMLVVGRIEDLTKKAIAVQRSTAPVKSVEELLAEGESQFVEYKSSLMWDYRQQRINKKLYTPVMKSLAAFMNSRGGHLLIGVDDEGNILGIEADLQGMKKPNLDGWENVFNLAFNSMIGVAYRRLIELEFYEKDGRTVCHVFVHPADRPIFLKENNTEKFYIRAGNASQPLSFSEAATYIQARFRI